MNKSRRIAVEKAAENVRNECHVIDYGLRDIFEAAGKIGYRIIRYPIGSESFLGFALIRDDERIIFSNSSSILSREIFTVAHEIGHHMLHLSEMSGTFIKDDDLIDRDETEIEANYFAACLLMPAEKVDKFVRLELCEKEANDWSNLDIARIQTAFNVSYSMALNRLESLHVINSTLHARLQNEKMETTTSELLRAISGNIDLSIPSGVKRVPEEYLEWVISNYREKLIPVESLKTALAYIGFDANDLEGLIANGREASKDSSREMG